MASEKDNASQEAGAAVTRAPRDAYVYRATNDIGLTRSEGDGMPTMTGHFAVWDQWTEINSAYEGHFLERFNQSAMDKTLRESTPKVLFNHGQDPQIGNKVLGSVQRVEPDQTGAFYEVALYDTSYNRDLIPALEAGQYGASFRFKVISEDYVSKPKRSDYNPRGLPERTVTEARVAEFGPVTFPAYPGATAGVRSITDEFLLGRMIEDPERLEALLRAIGKLPDKPERKTYVFSTKDAQVSTTANASVVVDPVLLDFTHDPNRDSVEPDPSEDTTPQTPGIEPEPSAATTPSTNRSLFWFVADPSLKGAKKQ